MGVYVWLEFSVGLFGCVTASFCDQCCLILLRVLAQACAFVKDTMPLSMRPVLTVWLSLRTLCVAVSDRTKLALVAAVIGQLEPNGTRCLDRRCACDSIASAQLATLRWRNQLMLHLPHARLKGESGMFVK
mgnify:CR=1 FL=1